MVRVFADCPERIYDGRVAQIGNLEDHPEPPREILFEHFKQCVLANVRGAGAVTVYDFDPDEHAQRMVVFEEGEGKIWLETRLNDKLASAAMKAASA
jgi:hypothetical protein